MIRSRCLVGDSECPHHALDIERGVFNIRVPASSEEVMGDVGKGFPFSIDGDGAKDMITMRMVFARKVVYSRGS
jgi:hypothetical protein